MNRHSALKRILLAFVPALMLLLSASLWAADATPLPSRGSVELQDPVNVAGTQLQSGKYRVEWTGAGDQVEVKIYSGNKAVVSTHARLVKNATSYDYHSYAVGENGTKFLTEISFGKQRCALRFQNDPASPSAERAAK